MNNIDHDRLFKELLTNFFQEFIEAFFPEADRLLDYSYLEFLTQEVFTDITVGEKKYIDILVKTRLQGEEGFVLVHVESQAQKRKDFARRMFRYYARLFLKYDLRVLPIAVLSHGIKKKEPHSFKVAFPFHQVLDFNFLQLHLKRHSWKDYLKKANPVAAALMSCMDYKEEEKIQLKTEFLKLILRMRLDPARMQLLIGFFETYAQLTWQEEEIVQRKLTEELPPGEVKEMTEILTSYHLRGKEEGRAEGRAEGRVEGRAEGRVEGRAEGRVEGRAEGRAEGRITALQRTLIKLARRKLGTISLELKNQILKNTSIPQLENALENIFDFDSEEALLKALQRDEN